MFHCAGREPGTGSAKTGDAVNSIAATAKSVAYNHRETKQRNQVRSALIIRIDIDASFLDEMPIDWCSDSRSRCRSAASRTTLQNARAPAHNAHPSRDR